MSWSIQFIGTPENVAKAIKLESKKFTGQTKIEYDIAAPHIVSLVEQNHGTAVSLIRCLASGHATISDDPKLSYGNCVVTIENIYGNYVGGLE